MRKSTIGRMILYLRPLSRSVAAQKPSGMAIATAPSEEIRLVAMAPVMFDSSKTWRKLSSVNPATSMSPLQKLDSATITSAATGRIVATKL